MTYPRFILRNIGRKKTRMLLTMGSFAVALFLFGVLAAIQNAFYQGVEMAGVDRLIVRHKTSMVMPLPYSYKAKIRQIPGVAEVLPGCWFGGVYQEPKYFFPQFAFETEELRRVYPEYTMPEEQWKAYCEDMQGCIVGRKLLKRFGWKIGDRIPLRGTIYPGIWEFNIRAVFENTRQEDDTGAMFMHYKYLDERRPFKGLVAWFVVKVEKPDTALAVARAIDAQFSGSSYGTFTETEQAFQTDFVKRLGDIKLILMTVGSVVFFTLLLVTGSTMAIAIRERTNEIGVMKTLGFSDPLVLVLVLSESLVLALLGGGIGLVLAKLFTLGGDPTGGMLRIVYLSPPDMLAGFAITLAVGFGSGIVPALDAMRLSIVDSLRRV